MAGSAPSTRRTLPSPSTLLRRISSARQPSRATRVLSREVGDCYASERERLLVRLRSAATSPRVSSASARRTRPRTSCSPSSDAFTTLRRGVVVSRARANTRSFLLLRQLPLVVAGKGLTIPLEPGRPTSSASASAFGRAVTPGRCRRRRPRVSTRAEACYSPLLKIERNRRKTLRTSTKIDAVRSGALRKSSLRRNLWLPNRDSRSPISSGILAGDVPGPDLLVAASQPQKQLHDRQWVDVLSEVVASARRACRRIAASQLRRMASLAGRITSQ